MKCLRLLAVLPIVFGISCASHRDRVDVSVYHLQDLTRVDKDNPMVRSEQQKRLYGAVDLNAQNDRKGQYYTVLWDVRDQAVDEPVSVVFSYRQAGTGSKVLKQVNHFDAGKSKGDCEFAIVGNDYNNHGRVLSWKIEVFSGSQLLVKEQSYLWE